MVLQGAVNLLHFVDLPTSPLRFTWPADVDVKLPAMSKSTSSDLYGYLAMCMQCGGGRGVERGEGVERVGGGQWKIRPNHRAE